MLVLDKLAELYHEMEEGYNKVSMLLDFDCQGCPDNCCDSYFLHHTHLEWAYLWEGFEQLPQAKQDLYLGRSKEYINESRIMLAKQERPEILCPLNDDGRCGLYRYRLMICRLHGVPTSMTLPNGQKKNFPGCYRCQDVTKDRSNLPTMDRTKFFREMVSLEHELLGETPNMRPKIKLTIAAMLVQGKPPL